MESLRLLRWYDSSKVRLRRRSNKSDLQDDGSNTASPLKVLWYGADPALLQVNRDRFKNLVSLDSGATLTASEWREFLEGPSRNLKHLRFGFEGRKNGDHSGAPTLCLPKLEVLEMNTPGDYPQWLLIPDPVKLIAYSGVHNLPSISELWSWHAHFQENDIVNRLPKVKVICLLSPNLGMGDVLKILQERRANVEAGLHVDGVKMEMIKILVIPSNSSYLGLPNETREFMRECKELLEVVEEDSGSRSIEVEF